MSTMRLLGVSLCWLLPSLLLAAQDLDLHLDPQAGTLHLRQQIPWQDGAGSLRLRLSPGLQLTMARGEQGELAVLHQGHDWQIEVPSSTTTLVVEVAGTLANFAADGSDGIGLLLSEDGSLLLGSQWLVWPYPAAYRLSVTVPAGQRVVATGTLLEEQQDSQHYRAVFSRDRVGDPPVVMVGPYQIDEQYAGNLRLRSYFHPDIAPQAPVYLEAAAAYLQRFSDTIGAYPYSDFHVVSTPLPVGLGFPGVAYISRRIVPLAYMRGRSLAHEVLHNWWGNGVAVDYASGNWAEGLTTYLADYQLAEDQGAEAARTQRLEWLRDFSALPGSRDRPLRAFTRREHDAAHVVGYRKGALVFHMLRRRLGEADFSASLRHFWQTQRFQVASWDDLRRSVEVVSGQNWEGFFRQWLERSGAPELALLAVAQQFDSHGVVLSLTLAQKQQQPAYDLRVPVVVDTEQGRQTLEAAMEQRQQVFQWRLDAPVQALVVDPDFQLLRRLDLHEAPPILRDVTLAAHPGVMLLGEDPTVSAIARQLAERLLDGEPRWLAPGDWDGRELLLMGTPQALEQAAGPLGLSPMPEVLPREADAWVWTERLMDGRTVLVVSFNNARVLADLLTPLPHYGRRSYLAFRDASAVVSGTWEGQGGALHWRSAEVAESLSD